MFVGGREVLKYRDVDVCWWLWGVKIQRCWCLLVVVRCKNTEMLMFVGGCEMLKYRDVDVCWWLWCYPRMNLHDFGLSVWNVQSEPNFILLPWSEPNFILLPWSEPNFILLPWSWENDSPLPETVTGHDFDITSWMGGFSIRDSPSSRYSNMVPNSANSETSFGL